MKQLFENRRYIASIFLTILMVFCTSMSGYANGTPVFTDGASTTRSVAENTAVGTNIGTPIAATDADNDVLTYTLGGTDAAAFSIVRTSGQLQTSAALNYETKSSYAVTVSVSDGNGGSDTISVRITVTDVVENSAPVFTDGASATRTIAENSAAGRNIGTPIAATDVDNNALTYSLGGTDASSFNIVRTTGQLQTSAALNYETQSSYSVTVSVSDGNGGSGNIPVTIRVSNVNEKPYFAPGGVTLTVAENTASGTNIGVPFRATDPDRGDTLTYSLERGDRDAFRIDPNTGQLRTRAALDCETKRSYTDLAVRATDSTGLVGSTLVRVNVTDVDENRAPVFTDGAATTRAIAENTAANTNIGTPVAATDADNDTLTYRLGGTDASAFRIVRTSGQLRTRAVLDYETKTSYSVAVSVSDGNGGNAIIPITISVTDVNETPNNTAPIFTDGTSATRAVAENTAFGENIGTPVAATDADANATLTYSLGGTDAGSFSIVSTSGQLQTSAALDYETKSSYSVSVFVSDGNGGSDSITVTINVTNVTDLSDRTPAVRDAIVAAVPGVNNANDVTTTHLAAITSLDVSDKSISSLKADDFNGLTALTSLNLSSNLISDISVLTDLTSLTFLRLYGNSISDISPLEGLTSLRALYLSTNKITDISPLEDLTSLVSLDLTRNKITDISPLEDLTSLRILYLSTNKITDISPLEGLTSLETLSLYKNRITDISPLEDLTSLSLLNLKNNRITDVSPLEDLTSDAAFWLVIYLAGNPISDYGPLRRLKAANPNFEIDVNITNNIPVFTDGTSTTRSIAENTASGTNIGAAVSATDADTNDTLTYSLGGTDAASFSIVSTSGQLQTQAALDFETKTSYTVTVDVSDGNDGLDRITVTITVTDEVGAAPSISTPPAPPETTALLSNCPNPFNPETWIPYQLAKPAEVTLTIYDIRGVVVRRLALGHQAEGVYHSRSRAIHWDGRNDVGEKVASGLYFYTFTAGDFTATQKLLIRK